MNATKHSLLVTLYAIFVKGKKHYICPAPNTLIALLHKFHKRDIQRRWLFYCLADLRARKIIRMKRRYITEEYGLVRSIPSMISLTTKGVEYMQRKLMGDARELYARMMEWLNRDRKQFPKPHDLVPSVSDEDRQAALMKIKTLIRDIG